MIDLHTHTLLSDGVLLPSEMVRRADVLGYTAIGLTDHVDSSNIDFVLPRLVKVSKLLNRYWDIKVLPGVEITHAPLEEIKPLARYARKNGAKIVIVHGETVSEPVIPGTNRMAIESAVDILAHPGLVKREEAALAKKKGVLLELTTKKAHLSTNKHVVKMTKLTGAPLVLNTDAHSPEDLISKAQAKAILRKLGLSERDILNIFNRALDFVKRARS